MDWNRKKKEKKKHVFLKISEKVHQSCSFSSFSLTSLKLKAPHHLEPSSRCILTGKREKFKITEGLGGLLDPLVPNLILQSKICGSSGLMNACLVRIWDVFVLFYFNCGFRLKTAITHTVNQQNSSDASDSWRKHAAST